MKGKHKICGVVCAALLFGFGTTVAADNPEDPWEGWNRAVWKFNKTADTYFLKPVAKGYDWVTPKPVDDGISNVFDNLGETRNFLNDVLQFKFADAGTDLARFVINSTVGVLGIFDVASRWGLDRNEEDFGQTLAAWGVESGPYLVLPFLGPSTVRDGIGLIPDIYSVPQAYIDHDQTRYSVYATDFIDTRADLLDVEELVQGDEYSFVRDVYLQRRAFLVTDGDVEDDFTSDDFEEDY
ncbi:MAG: VacJ family lipoprotein [Pseudomonadales bacterium]|jgi:phospholipid-binding lipoprotein MlaA